MTTTTTTEQKRQPRGQQLLQQQKYRNQLLVRYSLELTTKRLIHDGQNVLNKVNRRGLSSIDSSNGGASFEESGQPGGVVASSSLSRYAVVDHSMAYDIAMQGQHGQQLSLAELEGIGKDDPPYDPFSDAEDNEDDEDEEEYDEADGDDDDEEDASNGYGDDVDSHRVHEEDFKKQLIEFRSKYNNDGSIRRTKTELATYRAGSPGGGMFAIIEMAGTQFKITTDDTLIVNKLRPISTYSIGSTHTLPSEHVLLIGCTHYTWIGLPNLRGSNNSNNDKEDGGIVKFMVEEITQDAKDIVFKKRRRKHSKRKRGFRRQVTVLRILDIQPPKTTTVVDGQEQQQTYHFIQRSMPGTELDEQRDDDDDEYSNDTAEEDDLHGKQQEQDNRGTERHSTAHVRVRT